MVVPIADQSNPLLVGFVDVLHDVSGLGCCAGLLVLNQHSEPVEFVFNRSPSGCDSGPFRALWPQRNAARSEGRALLQSLFSACRSDPAVLIAPEEHVDVRLLALDIRIGIPFALLWTDAPDVLRWVPAQPPEGVKEVVAELGKLAPLAEPIERVKKGLLEAYLPPPS